MTDQEQSTRSSRRQIGVWGNVRGNLRLLCHLGGAGGGFERPLDEGDNDRVRSLA